MLHYPLGTRWLALDSRVEDLMIKAEGGQRRRREHVRLAKDEL